MRPMPWLPVMELAIIGAGCVYVWWMHFDRRRWQLIRAYRKHRSDVEARRHIEWAAGLLKARSGSA
jgi:hypothetical protein